MKKIITLILIALIWISTTSLSYGYTVDLYKNECSISTQTKPSRIDERVFNNMFKNSVANLKNLGTPKQVCDALKQVSVISSQKEFEIELSNFIFFYTLQKSSNSKKNELLKKYNIDNKTTYTNKDIAGNVIFLKSVVSTNRILFNDAIKSYLNSPKSTVIVPKVKDMAMSEMIVEGVYNGGNKGNITINGGTYKNINMFYSTLTEINAGKSFIARIKGDINSFSILDIQFR